MGHCNTKSTHFKQKPPKRLKMSHSLSKTEHENLSQLCLALQLDNQTVAKTLIQLGADVNQACGGLCMTPLHLAVANRDVEIVKMLLEAGADPNVIDKWNYTPLMYAAIHYDACIVNDLFHVLLMHGADANFGACINRDGAVINAKNVDLLELRSGENGDYITYTKDPMGPTSGTALHQALQNPYLPNESIEILLQHGADVHVSNLHGQTCLMGALRDVYYDYHSNVKSNARLLLNHGADPNAKDLRGWTSFHYAAQRGSIPGMELLLSAHGDCNLSSHVGETPLWLLLACGWREASEYLLRSGCDVNRPASSHIILTINQNVDICRYGDMRPLEFALCNRQYKIAKLIVKNDCRIDYDTWLGNQAETSSSEHEAFLSFLQFHMDRRKTVKSLLECCRDCFRKFARQGIVLKMKSIVLPQSLKDFVSFEGVS